jgi:beta-mannosidase
VGFRTVELDRTDGRVQFIVNGVPIFCRGSCWSNNDIVSLVGDSNRMRQTLALLAEANANMVRVGGTMVYETDEFYGACDELGLMVWQDFMFANMDYPVDDGAFGAEVEAEADQQLHRMAAHPCVVAYCGGSEVEQQAAMFGAPREIWSNRFFRDLLPSLVERRSPGTPYWPSTPTGGVLPFYLGEGLSHYYGVGAYRRPLEDVRLAGVKFSPECLGLSHVPEAANLRRLGATESAPPHDPAWKRGVPRDVGSGWDFEDVRDHYLALLYGVDPVRLRSEDLRRYLELSRVVTGEVMASVFGEWRVSSDPCSGALTWFLQDLRPGAGWGMIDSDCVPKASYYHLRRAWAPVVVRLLDRGLDGLVALVINESDGHLDAEVELLSIAHGAVHGPSVKKALTVAPRCSTVFSVEDAFGYFMDSTFSYRFGPPRHEAIVARLLRADRADVVSEDVYRPDRSCISAAPPPLIEVEPESEGAFGVTLRSETILYDVRIVAGGYNASDNHFCLTPGRPKTVHLRPSASIGRGLDIYIEALNLTGPIQLSLAE